MGRSDIQEPHSCQRLHTCRLSRRVGAAGIRAARLFINTKKKGKHYEETRLYLYGAPAAVPLHRSIRRRTYDRRHYRTGLPDRQGGIQDLRPNELFKLKVDVGIPRFADLQNMELIVELDGVKIDQTDLKLEDGTYYITGIVIDQPAALRVAIKDMAYNNAETAEELYNAMQKDRTVSKTYYFNIAQAAEQPIAKNPIVIPKTGDAPGMIAFTAVSAASLFGIGKVYAMACKKGRKGGKGGRGGGC